MPFHLFTSAERAQRRRRFGRKVRLLREIAGLTQSDMAKLFDKNERVVARWERGTITPIPDAGYQLVKDVDYDSLIEAEAARIRLGEALQRDPRNRVLLDEQTECDRIVFQATSRLYECPQCGRLMIQGENGYYRVYVPEPCLKTRDAPD